MSLWRCLAVGVIALACAACGTTQDMRTPTTRTEVIVPSRDLNVVRSVLINRMTSIGYRVSQDAQSTITFDKRADTSGQLFAGWFGDPPSARVSTALVESPEGIRIAGDLALVSNAGTGLEQRGELTGKDAEAVRQALEAVVQDVRAMPPPPPRGKQKTKTKKKKKTAELWAVSWSAA